MRGIGPAPARTVASLGELCADHEAEPHTRIGFGAFGSRENSGDRAPRERRRSRADICEQSPIQGTSRSRPKHRGDGRSVEDVGTQRVRLRLARVVLEPAAEPEHCTRAARSVCGLLHAGTRPAQARCDSRPSRGFGLTAGEVGHVARHDQALGWPDDVIPIVYAARAALGGALSRSCATVALRVCLCAPTAATAQVGRDARTRTA